MRIGIYVSTRDRPPIDEALARIQRAEERGFHTAWVGQVNDYDPLILLALAGRVTQGVELGSWVVPSYASHPAALAQRALTVQAASANRLALGIGLSHRAIIEKRLGLDYGRPLRHMREYLSVLEPLLRKGEVRFAGKEFRVATTLDVPGAARPPILLAALGPKMLKLAGERADGVAIWLANQRYLEEFALPRLQTAAQAAGRPAPRVACGFAIAVSKEREAAHRSAAAFLDPSARLPAYQNVLAHGRAQGAADVALIGFEDALADQLQTFAKLGVSDVCAVLFDVEGDPEARPRTARFLAGLARGGL